MGEKVRAYQSYRQSPKLQARYGVDTFTVLVVAPTEVRLRRIADEVLRVNRQPTNTYLLLTADRVHSTTIRPSWKAVQAFEVERRSSPILPLIFCSGSKHGYNRAW
jgi:hypothetical protein